MEWSLATVKKVNQTTAKLFHHIIPRRGVLLQNAFSRYLLFGRLKPLKPVVLMFTLAGSFHEVTIQTKHFQILGGVVLFVVVLEG
jgi:hypothetical protein